jgi:hypothetical protein
VLAAQLAAFVARAGVIAVAAITTEFAPIVSDLCPIMANVPV